MELHTYAGTISISSKGLLVNCKVKDLNNVFTELFKLAPKETKVEDVKKVITNKIAMCLS